MACSEPTEMKTSAVKIKKYLTQLNILVGNKLNLFKDNFVSCIHLDL